METIGITGEDRVVRDVHTRAILNTNSTSAKVAEARKEMAASIQYLSTMPTIIKRLETRIGDLEKIVRNFESRITILETRK